MLATRSLSARAAALLLGALLALLLITAALISVVTGISSQSCGQTVVGGAPVQAAKAIPANLMPIYTAAQKRYGVPWNVLAAINEIETDFGRDLSVSSAGAVGWMQIEPATWAEYKVAAHGHKTANPYNPWDAIFTAANILRAAGAPGDLSAAIFAYNHADWYVSEVLALARSYAKGPIVLSGDACTTLQTTPGEQAKITASGVARAPADAPIAVQELIAAGNQIIDKPYPSPDQHYGPLDQLWPAYDCSGSVSYVLYRGGLLGGSALVASQFERWGKPGPGRWITIYANNGHVFIKVAGIVLNTVWYAPVHPVWPPSGPRWQPGSTVAAQQQGDIYGGFVERHPAGL